jgi:hypothetical protein
VVFEGAVWSEDALPANFDLSKSTVISFESDRVRFFDFELMEGCYYHRIKPN